MVPVVSGNLEFGGGGGIVAVSPWGDPAIPALRLGPHSLRSRVLRERCSLVEPVAGSHPPSITNKNATARVAFVLV
ncbi:MAG: hypothetical protein AB1513_04675, partial [Pseudomonadota bacterium]